MKLFITGTDTGIGKTYVAAALAQQALLEGLSVGYYKPIQTGTPPGELAEDCDFVQSALDQRVPVFNRYCFAPPVTPSVADTEGIIRFEAIAGDVETYNRQFDLLLVEGAGGLMVPVTPDSLMIDLIEALAMPVVLVAHSRLGTLNHTLLSVEALMQRNIPLHGIVINFYPESLDEAPLAVQTLIPTLKQHLPAEIPVWTCPESSAHEKTGPLCSDPVFSF